jgi:hypothetical protein
MIAMPDGVNAWLLDFRKDVEEFTANREWTRLAHSLTMMGVPQHGGEGFDSSDPDLLWVEAHPEEYRAAAAALLPQEALKPLAAVFSRDVKASRICARPEYAAYLKGWLRSL